MESGESKWLPLPDYAALHPGYNTSEPLGNNQRALRPASYPAPQVADSDITWYSENMTTLEVKLNLPDPLAVEAQAAGLLAPEQLERLLREALRAGRIEKLAAAREALAATPLPTMTPEEIQAEIDAYRAEVRRAAGA